MINVNDKVLFKAIYILNIFKNIILKYFFNIISLLNNICYVKDSNISQCIEWL